MDFDNKANLIQQYHKMKRALEAIEKACAEAGNCDDIGFSLAMKLIECTASNALDKED